MQPRTFTPSCISLLLGLCLILVSSTAISQEISPGCEAAMNKAAGSLSECLLKAEAKFAKGGDEGAKEAAQARCGGRFDRDNARAMSRFGAEQCTPASLVTAMEESTVIWAEAVSIQAGGELVASRLYVQDATGGTLTEMTLVLSGVDQSTSWFGDRPYRQAGQITTAEFVALFSEEGTNSFIEDPPNANFTCEVEGDVVNQAVTLTEPVLDEAADTLTYTATLLPTAGDDGYFAGITCDGEAYLFIDDNLVTVEGEVLTAADWWEGVAASAEAGCETGAVSWGGCLCPCNQPPPAPAVSDYNCFVGGLCSKAAQLFPPVDYGYTNAYDGHTPGTEPASGSGCNVAPGAPHWLVGEDLVNYELSSSPLFQAFLQSTSNPCVSD